MDLCGMSTMYFQLFGGCTRTLGIAIKLDPLYFCTKRHFRNPGDIHFGSAIKKYSSSNHIYIIAIGNAHINKQTSKQTNKHPIQIVLSLRVRSSQQIIGKSMKMLHISTISSFCSECRKKTTFLLFF